MVEPKKFMLIAFRCVFFVYKGNRESLTRFRSFGLTIVA